ncbi:hypothetical protein CEXT_554681 [Caerostris extrusa]|uniref:Uncharacterized protein n=1 Tax=Caerostris extrusa TaxID=172846 RepID=A0AAV4S8Y1_CAEEX|nr:hypothetical protein CEXT_554681 [Caerostris extrusa]
MVVINSAHCPMKRLIGPVNEMKHDPSNLATHRPGLHPFIEPLPHLEGLRCQLLTNRTLNHAARDTVNGLLFFFFFSRRKSVASWKKLAFVGINKCD